MGTARKSKNPFYQGGELSDHQADFLCGLLASIGSRGRDGPSMVGCQESMHLVKGQDHQDCCRAGQDPSSGNGNIAAKTE